MRLFWNMFSRGLFIVGLALVLMPTFTGKLRGMLVFLGSDFWSPLSRLTFCVYLLHPLTFTWYYGTARKAVIIDPHILWINFFACTTITYIMAIPFSMLFEVPFMNIEKWLLFPPKKKPAALVHQPKDEEIIPETKG